MQPAKLNDLNIVIESIIISLISIAGAVFLIMLVLAGYKYLSAGTDKQTVQKAQHMVTYAVIGLIVVASAWMLVVLGGNVIGINSPTWGNFNICIGSGC